MEQTTSVPGLGTTGPQTNGVSLRRRDGMVLNRINQGIFALLGLLVLYVLSRAFLDNPSVSFSRF